MLSRRKEAEKKRFWRYVPEFELISGEVHNAIRSADGPDAVPEMRIEMNDGRLFQIKGSSMIPRRGDDMSIVMTSAEGFASDVVIGIFNHKTGILSICESRVSELASGSFLRPIASVFGLIYFFGSSEKVLILSALLFAVSMGQHFDPTIAIPLGLAAFIAVIKLSLVAIRNRLDARIEYLRHKVRSLVELSKIGSQEEVNGASAFLDAAPKIEKGLGSTRLENDVLQRREADEKKGG